MEGEGETKEGVKDDDAAGVKPKDTATVELHANGSTTDSGDQHVIANSTSQQRISAVPSPQIKPRPKPRTRTRPNVPTLSSMPAATLSGLQLHSPSNIIGTPFDLNSSPFEYPFPPNSNPASISDPSLRPLTPPSLLTNSLTLSAPTVALTPSPFNSDARSFSPTHPKMRMGDPPVPPGLVKKRQRWSLTLTRRESSFSSQASEGARDRDRDRERERESPGASSPRSPPPESSSSAGKPTSESYTTEGGSQ